MYFKMVNLLNSERSYDPIIYYDNPELSCIFYDIEINDLPRSINNWNWAANQLWCTGSGKIIDPYMIDGHIFEYSSGITGNCISVINSKKYFVIIFYISKLQMTHLMIH